MKTTSTKKAVVPYEDRAAAMKKKSVVAEIKTLNSLAGQFETICETMAADTIQAANKSREIGLHLMTICGHEQISFEFWRNHCEGKVNKLTFDQAKRHISTAHKMPKPAKTIADTAPFFQSLLFAANLLEAPVREESQRALAVSLIQEFLAGITTVRQPFERVLRETPMEKWKPSQLDSFLSDTEWLSVARDRALKLRGEVYRNL